MEPGALLSAENDGHGGCSLSTLASKGAGLQRRSDLAGIPPKVEICPAGIFSKGGDIRPLSLDIVWVALTGPVQRSKGRGQISFTEPQFHVCC